MLVNSFSIGMYACSFWEEFPVEELKLVGRYRIWELSIGLAGCSGCVRLVRLLSYLTNPLSISES